MNLWMGAIDVVKNHEVGIVSPAYITMQPNENLVDNIVSEPYKYGFVTEIESEKILTKKNGRAVVLALPVELLYYMLEL